jgi:Xaa-Pro aminopeptidase
MTEASRLRALQTWLVREQVDALLVTSKPNVEYLTRFTGSNAILVVGATGAVLLTDFRYASQVQEEVVQAADDQLAIRIEAASLWDGVWVTLSGWRGVHVVGFESAHLRHRDFERLQERAEGWHWRATTDLVERLRITKDPEEVAAIVAAGRAASHALARTLEKVRVGQTELAVCGMLERQLREAGSTAHPFPPIVASGSRSALPHARASSRELVRGDLLLLDFGATVDGYCSDVTRTVLLGRADDRQREVYDVVRRAQRAALDGVRAGLTGREADALARGVIEQAGLGEAFGHGLGHGLGIEVHEAPRLSRLSEEPLPVGAVVTIEPGVYVPGWGGVRIEDDVVLRAEAADVLTEFPRELVELDV